MQNANSTSANKIVSNKSNPAIHMHTEETIDIDRCIKKQQQRHSICTVESIGEESKLAQTKAYDVDLSELSTSLNKTSQENASSEIDESSNCDLSLNRSSCECSVLMGDSMIFSLDDSFVSSNPFDSKTDDGKFNNSEKKTASLLSVTSSLSVCGSSGSSCGCNNISNNSTVIGGGSPLMISLSKSETNIFDEKADGNKLEIFNVVSLNDLNDTELYFNRPMNDLSKTQCLTKISDQDIHYNNPTHMAPLAVPNAKISISPSLESKDISNKIF